LLLLAGLDMHQVSIRSLFSRKPVRGRALEMALIGGRFALYLGLLFWLLPVGMAFSFVGVQLAVFGVYMAASFAPNHIGMPIVPHDAKLDFLDKQVLTSRNVAGGWWMTALMGGLNYQIEHHLFPSMPRPHLRRARQLVQAYCREHGVLYTETSLREAWVIVIRYMNEVGLSASRSFRCPTAGAMGRA
jgi:fatty acid desaturase